MQQILEMLRLQQELNDSTNGEGWEKGRTKNDKLIDWKRCIYMEAAELIDSFAWKHWKSIHQEPDWENIRIEVVDIWHFVMSQLLQEYRLGQLGSIEDLAQHIVKQPTYSSFSDLDYRPEVDMYALIKMVEEMMFEVLKPKGFDVNALINDFFAMALHCGVNLQTMYGLYIGKNILNRFRQDHGYKDGTYIKIWNTQEDNIVMLDIMAKNPSYGVDELYKALEEVYQTL
jgi:dimeric dUTPase (all-alpha-NTP-PPase superfamily)